MKAKRQIDSELNSATMLDGTGGHVKSAGRNSAVRPLEDGRRLSWPDLDEYLPTISTFDYSQCRHENVAPQGKAMNGEPILRCRLCRTHFMQTCVRAHRGSYLRSIGSHFLIGTNAKGCARILGVSEGLVGRAYRKIRKLLDEHPNVAARLDLRNAYSPKARRWRTDVHPAVCFLSHLGGA